MEQSRGHSLVDSLVDPSDFIRGGGPPGDVINGPSSSPLQLAFAFRDLRRDNTASLSAEITSPILVCILAARLTRTRE